MLQYFNTNAVMGKVVYYIYDSKTLKINTPVVKKINEQNITNGLNRISINLKDYDLKPEIMYLLVISDHFDNYHLNFKMASNDENRISFIRHFINNKQLDFSTDRRALAHLNCKSLLR